MKANIKIANLLNAALASSIVMLFVLGCVCGPKKDYQSSGSNPSQAPAGRPAPGQIYREQKAVGTITSANAGGFCSKRINGQMVTSPQIQFSYTVDGKDYENVGCVYDSPKTAGTHINVCYPPGAPEEAKPCSD